MKSSLICHLKQSELNPNSKCSQEKLNRMTKYNLPDLGKNAEGPVWEEVWHALTFRCGRSLSRAVLPEDFLTAFKGRPRIPWLEQQCCKTPSVSEQLFYYFRKKSLFLSSYVMTAFFQACWDGVGRFIVLMHTIWLRFTWTPTFLVKSHYSDEEKGKSTTRNINGSLFIQNRHLSVYFITLISLKIIF